VGQFSPYRVYVPVVADGIGQVSRGTRYKKDTALRGISVPFPLLLKKTDSNASVHKKPDPAYVHLKILRKGLGVSSTFFRQLLKNTQIRSCKKDTGTIKGAC
jgi:hypothetical protein